MERPHLLVAQRGGHRVVIEFSILVLAQPMLGAYPDGPIPIFQERTDTVINQSILRSEVMNTSLIEATHSVIGPNPKRAIFGFEKDAHKIVHQAFVCSEVRGSLGRMMIDAAAVGPDPKRSIPAAQHIRSEEHTSE